MRRVLLLALSLGVLATQWGLWAGGEQQAFTLAVLRRDGVIVPFANYSGGNWSNRWPTPFVDADIPITLRDVPGKWWGREGPSTTWTLWPLRGKPRPIHVTGPVLFDTHCVSNIGLKTDYEAPEPIPPPFLHHHPKDGLAVTGDLAIERIEVLDEASPEWSPLREGLQQALQKDIDVAESRAVPSFFDWRRAIKSRSATPVKLETLCRSPWLTPGTFLYYIEALRRYPPSKEESPAGCDLVAFTQGFARFTGATVGHTNVGTTLADCQLVSVDYMLPLGAFRIDGRLYWAVQWAGRGRERYSVMEFGDKTVKYLVETPGGGC
jgi:hypothetical protein